MADPPPMRIQVAQIGARRHYAVPRALATQGALESLITDACAEIPPWRWLDRLWSASGRPRGLRRLLERRLPEVPRSRISGLPLFALSNVWDRRGGESDTDRWARRNAAFCRAVIRSGFGRADAVYAYNGAALEIFQAARAQGLRTVLDQTAAPWRWNRELLEEERRRWPGWEDQPAEIDRSGRLAEREEAEWALADRIICGSAFARDALGELGGPVDRCAVVPYAGYRLPAAGVDRRTRRTDNELRVLFVGTLQLRKGLPYLLEALRQLADLRLKVRLVGPSRLSDWAMRELGRWCEIVGPVARDQVAAHYAWADVFVLPTLSEGSANVVYEAMAAGLAVITTPHAGSMIRDGVEGLLVPIRDGEALAVALTRLMEDQGLGSRLGETARSALAEVDPAVYADRLIKEVLET
ncbi:MAG: glycosyltransferase family 4 protein [Thiocapsa sp.]|uniref:glycosyltransferase family 4 protein n=1 Tax=Thiocapsa sp. TaxID=2024551 RepID=UPI001BD0C900|nr:glycosyltransferase family 4 protein [Thiocapsa sp.]QVL50091.1 MAG: glycosyltransferase family 4 protein [Thiocapsa sp.]